MGKNLKKMDLAKKKSGMRRLFFIPTFIVLAVIYITVSVVFVGQYHKEYEDITLNNVKYIEHDITSWFSGTSDIVNIISSSLSYIEDTATISNCFYSIQNADKRIAFAYYGSMTPYKDGGTFIITDKMEKNYDQTERGWFTKAVKNSGKVIITDPYLDVPSEGQKDKTDVVMTIAKTVERDGEVKGVFAIDISTKEISDIISKYSESYGSEIFIVSPSGQYITHQDNSYIMNDNNILSILPSAIKNKILNGDIFFEYNKKYFYSSIMIPYTGWHIVDYGAKTYVNNKITRLMLVLFFAISTIFFAQFLLVNKIVIPLSNILSQAAVNMKEMSEGNFNITFDEKAKRRKDEAGILARSSIEMQKSLSSVLYTIRGNSEDINSLMNNMNRGIDNLSERTENQSASLEEVASSVEEMSASIKHTADNAKIAGSTSSRVKETTHSGVNIVNETIDNMQVIYEASKKISDITNVIENIAFQTNILALNAAVEAARAGEQGKGFAVVASEVRNLAMNTSNSAKDISSLISDTVAKIETGREASFKSGELLKETEKLVNEVVEFLNDISSSIIQEEKGVEQINTAIMSLNEINQENVSLVNESLNVSKNIFGKTESLLGEVSFFKFDDTDKDKSI